MCFWFGLVILVYKKAFFEILYGFLSYFTFYPPKKVGPPLIRVSSLAKGKKNLQKKLEFLGTWKILQKIVFLRKNLWELLDARVAHIFEISAKFRFF
jgi:hypothetical protein